MNVSELVGTASGRRRFLLWIKLVVVASLLSVSGAYLYHNRNIFAARAQEFGQFQQPVNVLVAYRSLISLLFCQ